MTQKFYAIVTNLGAAKIANAAALGTKLSITQMAVGDGGGALPTPNASQTKLVNEVRRAAINTLSIDPANGSQVIAEQVIPETEGGFWIREMGLFDADGTLIAVCNTPETYKPALQEGSGRTQTVRMLIIVNSTDAITLKIDPAVVLATRQYVDNAVIEVKAYVDDLMNKHTSAPDPHSQYLKKEQLSSATDSDSDTQVATPKAVKAVSPGRLLNVQVFDTSGTYKPTPGAKKAYARVMGAGGAGGGCPATAASQQSTGGSGQSGVYAEILFDISAASYTLTVGSAGKGATAVVGGNGGASIINGIINCPGGTGGYVGQASGATLAIGGTALSASIPTVTAGTLIYSTAPRNGEGTVIMGTGVAQVRGGRGGDSPFGVGGAAGIGGPGGSAVGHGAGGGGCSQYASNNGDKGGDGAGGIIIIEEFA